MPKTKRQSSSSKNARTVPMLRARAVRDWLSEYHGARQAPLALMAIGIKDLSQINQRFGRADGDALIRRVGSAIRRFAASEITGIELVARLPGREFLLAVGGEAPEEIVEAYAASLLKILSADFGREGEPMHISARIGIAVAGEDEIGEELLHRASQALAQAYGRKGKKFVVAEAGKAQTSYTTAVLDADLRAAIENRQITILLQPQFEVGNGRLVGAEALARWHHAEFGEIGADALFAAADRCDLREELSHAIQQQAIAIAASWPAALDILQVILIGT